MEMPPVVGVGASGGEAQSVDTPIPEDKMKVEPQAVSGFPDRANSHFEFRGA